jgi:hypothetical protein
MDSYCQFAPSFKQYMKVTAPLPGLHITFYFYHYYRWKVICYFNMRFSDINELNVFSMFSHVLKLL